MFNFNVPQGDLMIAPERQSWVENTLTRMAEPSFAERINQEWTEAPSGGFWSRGDDFWARPYNVQNGVLTIPVKGMLMNDLPFQFDDMATGYEYIEAAIERGASDPQVREIVMDIDSPGGTVAGCFDCADAIYEARGAKPIRAVANEFAYSAAYAIASAADDISVARTGGVGSIGVIATHIEMSRALEARGMKVTLIYAGEQKADGHPARPLSEKAQARMQKRVDALYEIFVSTVARNRGMDEQAVRDTEAATYMAREAVEIGLADAEGDLDNLSATADHSHENGDEEMSKNDTPAVEQAVTPEALAEAEAAAQAAGQTAGEAAGRSAERERIAAILDSDEAKKRPVAARQVALNTDMDTEKAATFLAALPVESKGEEATGPSSFETAMNSGEHPEVGATEEAGNTAEPERHERVLSTVRSLGLAGFKSKES